MRDTHTLTRHKDIQNWVATHNGMPALVCERDSLGSVKARLALSFQRARLVPTGTPNQDDGISPCSWSAWLAELDRQHLALMIKDDDGLEFEFIARRDLH